MANYLAINSNRTDKKERVTLWQNKLIQKAKAFKCDFGVDWSFEPQQAMVTYRDKQGLEPIIKLSRHLSQPTSKCGVMAILHELGHVMDYRKHESNFLNYIMIGNGEVEVRAWEFAFELAWSIGFKPVDYKEMHEYALECLYTYSNNGTDMYNMRDMQIGCRATPMTWEEAQQRMDTLLSNTLKKYQRALLGL